MRTATHFQPSVSKDLIGKTRIAIVQALYNTQYTELLERKCRETLLNAGMPAEHIDTFTVPGALEIPVTAQVAAKTGKYQAIIALGLVMKGETYHFELVADQCAAGCMQVSLHNNIPVIMEVLAAYTIQQAKDRCGDNDKNKGIEAAQAALLTIETLSQLHG
ncbi:6,7-dimethyl-8-ribityllumazine synthase [Patescibacteria group bacterium]|nr:6,7-dimethyl-8-ribityllumazine synthase [Patescibacteria group bacterium]